MRFQACASSHAPSNNDLDADHMVDSDVSLDQEGASSTHQRAAYPNLTPVLAARAIDWNLIRQQYDELLKYATALRLGTADAESILRRFVRQHPQSMVYQ